MRFSVLAVVFCAVFLVASNTWAEGNDPSEPGVPTKGSKADAPDQGPPVKAAIPTQEEIEQFIRDGERISKIPSTQAIVVKFLTVDGGKTKGNNNYSLTAYPVITNHAPVVDQNTGFELIPGLHRNILGELDPTSHFEVDITGPIDIRDENLSLQTGMEELNTALGHAKTMEATAERSRLSASLLVCLRRSVDLKTWKNVQCTEVQNLFQYVGKGLTTSIARTDTGESATFSLTIQNK